VFKSKIGYMGKINILVVEDEAFIGMNIRRRLEHLGYHVIMVVSSGDEAFQISTEKAPDLVLMDIQLEGGLDGLETAQSLWNRFEIPIVIVTGNIDSRTKLQADQIWCYGFVSKPFFSNELEIAVSSALDKIFYERYCSEDNSLKFLPNQYHPVAEWIKIHNDQLTFVSNVNDFLNDSIRFHPIHLFYSLGLDANKGNLQVDMREYLSRVIFYTREKFKIYNDVSVELQIDFSSVVLDEKLAIPIGIILNEFVSNSLKYAFSSMDNNAIVYIKFSIPPNKNMIYLQAKDNGIGFNNTTSRKIIPEEINDQPKGLGLWLIEIMAQTLHAESMLTGDAGTCLEVKIPYSPK
jgi:CheY-like chemotaxis protein